MGKEPLQGPERNLFEASLAVQGAKTTLENADFKIFRPGSLPVFAENDSAPALQIEQIRADAQEIFRLIRRIDEAVSQIDTGIIIPLQELDDIESINDDGGEPFKYFSGMPFRGHGENETDELRLDRPDKPEGGWPELGR